MTTALIVVDVQPTFCEGGDLPVDGGNRVAEGVAELLGSDHEYAMVVTTQDWHIDPGDHFSDTPDFVDSWPPHGVADSDDAALHPAVAALADRIDAGVKKGMYAVAYSGFEGVDPRGRTLHQVLQEGAIDTVDVVGLAFDHCVRATALDANRLGYRTRVLSALTAAVAAETAKAASDELDRAGVGLEVRS